MSLFIEIKLHLQTLRKGQWRSTYVEDLATHV